MSLSKNIKKLTGKEGSWYKYEMESFEPYELQKQGGKKDFVSLDTRVGERSNFIPLQTSGNTGNKEEVENGLLGRKTLPALNRKHMKRVLPKEKKTDLNSEKRRPQKS